MLNCVRLEAHIFLSTLIFLWILGFSCAFEQFLVLLTVFIFSLILLFPPLCPTFQKINLLVNQFFGKKVGKIAKKLVTGLGQVDSTCPSVKKV